ncbi:sensor histidine kinase [Bacillus sp. DTU_2020_1000418_1_SI_GHA_SEK_038]|uniref:sensor histidine kinase n=1 Tax=Bacillus sp. DTU_2020_1000418_1_SI_GHA_SEK_038 TaxID=3077585 RepID=UPI0028EC6926|nr:sensor histidine kinase [Bacillus sp. DTU_2020_1000418_1_SI_GHA_SEK_038]WNS75729.1 sensor histidine kinase [Bacillus sp. DTU_2020_1000418_1_SI_GHA_SEK_038]
MFELLVTMVERLGILVTIAFVLTRFHFFRSMIYQNQLNRKQQIIAILFFGFFGIIGTYSGLSLSTDSLQFNRWTSDLTDDEAIANSRVIGVVLAGLLGGYRVGIGAGLVAGIHRFSLGGFTALSCGLATIISGILAGLFYRKNKHVKLSSAFFIGALAESLQMLIILLLARPFDKAWTLVEIIGLPMILANGLGCALFLLIIKSVINEKEKAEAIQAQKTLRIMKKTLAHLRNGLHRESAKAVCQIIHKEINASAVAMTNSSEILAHVGLCDDHHRPDSPIQTQITWAVIKKGEMITADHETIRCRVKGCKLGAAVIAPLKQRGKTIGTLKFYFRSEKEINPVIMELISGLSALLSNQLELADSDKAYQLAKEAEIKALQAQISPHFLFNTLNTILSLIRINPAKARKLLVYLSHFLRQNLSVTTQALTTLEQELKQVKAYLAIEEARFIDKLTIIYEIEEKVLLQNIPPLTLQPIVENAIKHGMKDKERDCMIKMTIFTHNQATHVKITDNGHGMSADRSDQICKAPITSEIGSGLALYNVNRRLTNIFGDHAALKINSELEKGTEISFSIPFAEVKHQWNNPSEPSLSMMNHTAGMN